jgi:hypothetical protein
MAGFSYPSPIEFDDGKVVRSDHIIEPRKITPPGSRTPLGRSQREGNEKYQKHWRSDDYHGIYSPKREKQPRRSKDGYLRSPKRDGGPRPRPRPGQQLPKPGGPTMAKHRKAPGKSTSSNLDYMRNKNEKAQPSLAPSTPTKKVKKPISRRGLSLSPTPFRTRTPASTSRKPISLKTLFTPNRSKLVNQAHSELDFDALSQSLIFDSEITSPTEDERKTVRAAQKRSKDRSVFTQSSNLEYTKLQHISHPTSKEDVLLPTESINLRSPSLSPEHVKKTPSGFIAGFFDNVGELVNNLLEDEQASDDEDISMFDQNFSRTLSRFG